MLGYTGDSFDIGLARDIWKEKIEGEYDDVEGEYGHYDLDTGKITFSDVLLGNGKEGSAKLASVMAHEGTHAYGNRIEGIAHSQAANTYSIINNMFGLKADSKFSKGMIAGMLDSNSWVENTGNIDYWKVHKDGSLEYDGRKDLYLADDDGDNSNDKLIYKTSAKGVEGGLAEILFGKNPTEEQKREVRKLMTNSGLTHTVDKSNPYNESEWYWDRTGTTGDSALNKCFFTEGVDVNTYNMEKKISINQIKNIGGDMNFNQIIFDASEPVYNANTKEYSFKISNEMSYNILYNSGMDTHGLFDLNNILYSEKQIKEAERLKELANKNASANDLQTSGDITYCNFKVARDWADFINSSDQYSDEFSNLYIHPTYANDIGRNAANLRYPEYKNGLLAQIAANQGKLVLQSWIRNEGNPGHVATVVSNYGIYDPRLGPRISQAGATNGEMWSREGFGLNKMNQSKYYHVIKNSQYFYDLYYVNKGKLK